MIDGDRFPRKVGDILHLILNVGENRNDLHVRATLIDEDDNEVDVITLASTGSGLYEEHTETMPDVAQLKALYEVFYDAGFTTRAYEFPNAMDYFERDTLLQDISQTVSAAGRPADFVAEIVDDGELIAEMDQDIIQVAEIEDGGELIATIEDDESLLAEQQDGELIASTEC